jgi:hypothetical protein
MVLRSTFPQVQFHYKESLFKLQDNERFFLHENRYFLRISRNFRNFEHLFDHVRHFSEIRKIPHFAPLSPRRFPRSFGQQKKQAIRWLSAAFHLLFSILSMDSQRIA